MHEKKEILKIIHPEISAAEDPRRIRVPRELLAWLEDALNDHTYGTFGFYFILHPGKVRWHKINEESGDISEGDAL